MLKRQFYYYYSIAIWFIEIQIILVTRTYAFHL